MSVVNTKFGQAVEIDGKSLHIGSKCGLHQREGYWMCGDYGTRFHETVDLVDHLDERGRHTIFWMCEKHGPEVP